MEQPFEPDDSPLRKKAQLSGYPVQALGGVVFAYFGPLPAPILPRWDIFLRDDGERTVYVLPELNCNWLQVMENSCDPAHTYYLYAHTLALKGNAKRGAYYYRPIESVNFEIVKEANWCGVLKQRVYGGDDAETEIGHPVIFPTMLLSPQGPHLVMHMRLPVDDTHTQIFRYQFTPNADGKPQKQPEVVPVKKAPSFRNEDGEYHLDTFGSHDAMAWETQGEITDRSRENLGTTDQGISFFRRLLREQIKRVQDGKEPHGVIRDESLAGPIQFGVSTG